jgi:hypothetical protein
MQKTLSLSELRTQAAAADADYARMRNDVDVSDGELEAARERANRLHNDLRVAEAQARGYPLGGLTDVRFPLPGRP